MAGSGLRPALRANTENLGPRGTNFAGSGRSHWESTQPADIGPLWPSKGTHSDERETTDVSAESLQSVSADDFPMCREQGLVPTVPRGRWKLTPKGHALVGVVAIIGLLLTLKVGAPRSDLFAYSSPAHRQSPDGKTVAQSSNAGALSGKDSALPAQGNVAKEPLIDLSTEASPPPPPSGASPEVRNQPVAAASSATPVAQQIDTSPVASLSSQPLSTNSPDVRPARTVSSTSRATVAAVETTRPSNPKRPGKITNRVVVATTETTVPSAAPNSSSESAKPAKVEEASAPLAAKATGERATTVQPASPEGANPPLDPLLRTIGDLFGTRVSPAPQSIDPAPSGSTEWAVQLAASKSEDEAKNNLKRLNARHASALNGSTIGLYTALMNGETVYRLRVVGLSKSGASALCRRLSHDGGSCFIAK